MNFLYILLLSIGFFSLADNEQKQLNDIFQNDRKIKMEITYHGGYGTAIVGTDKIILKKKGYRDYTIKYKGYDGRKFNKTLPRKKIQELKKLLSELVSVHQPGKKLNGNCNIYDRNVFMKGKSGKFIIRPKTNAHFQQLALETWMEENIL